MKKYLDLLRQDIKERFANYETFKGIYFVFAGCVVIFVSIYYQQYVIQAVGVVFGWYFVSEGIRKICVNRFKQAEVREKIKEARKNVLNKS
jgi:hypothetical protein